MELGWFFWVLLLGILGALAVFLYICYSLWFEIAATAAEARRASMSIRKTAEQFQAMIPLMESFSAKARERVEEFHEVIELSRETAAQIAALTSAVAGFRSNEVNLALQYGKSLALRRKKSIWERILQKIRRFLTF